MNLFFKRILISSIFLFVSLNPYHLNAQLALEQLQPDHTEFKKLFNNEQYSEALIFGETKMSPSPQKDYLLGVTHARLKNYEQAINLLRAAILKEHTAPDLFYEYGQVLYANNNLKAARYAFLRSASNKFNVTASNYYIAYISELLEEERMAKFYYLKLIKDPKTDKKILQVSFFHYTKILLEMLKEQERLLILYQRELSPNIPKYILPLLERALKIDTKSELAFEIDLLLKKLTYQYNADPNVMLNGRRISPVRHYAYVALRLKHDDNVSSSDLSSALYEAEAFFKYDFVMKRRFISSPSFRVSQVRYRNQRNPEIFSNDSINISSSLRNRFEHKLGKRPASFMVDFDFATQLRDYLGEHNKKSYYQTFSYAIAEQFNLFSSGETTLRFRNNRYYDMINENNLNTSVSASIDQNIFLNSGQHLLFTSIDTSSTKYEKSEISSYGNYSLRLIYYMFEIFPTYTLQFGLLTTLTDTKLQKEFRGMELSLNPSFEIAKTISKNIRISASYNYFKNKSKMDFYDNERHLVSTDLLFNF